MTLENTAKKLGLTVTQLKTLEDAFGAVYGHIGGDIGPGPRKDGLWKRRDMLEILYDASRVEMELVGKGMGYKKMYPDGELIVKILNDPRNFTMADLLAKAPDFFPGDLFEG